MAAPALQPQPVGGAPGADDDIALRFEGVSKTFQAGKRTIRALRGVTVAAPRERAFTVFTEQFGTWWPREYCIGKADMAEGGGNQPENLATALQKSYEIVERLMA